jgi:hypothetical protein
MDVVISLCEYRETIRTAELKSLQERVAAIIDANPVEMAGYHLSLEEMETIERVWEREKRK